MVADALSPNLDDALVAWADRVRANREQVDRFREVADGDFYGPVAPTFRPQPEQEDDPVLRSLESLVQPGETLLDIGCGGGRYALPLASRAKRVIGIDPSPAMLATFRAGIEERQATNVELIESRWPMPDPPRADVALMANVAYDIEAIGPFLDAMEQASRRLCVAVLLEVPPPHAIDALWPAIHGEERAALPALPEFVSLQIARGRLCEIRLFDRPTEPVDPTLRLARARRMLWVREGSPKDRALMALLEEDRPPRRTRAGVVSWSTA